MKIVDAQIHLWSSGLPMPPHRQITSWGIDEALAAMDEAGIDAAIIHPPLSWDPSANALAEQAATLHPRRFGILGQVPIDRPAESRPLLASWRSRPGQCGLRWPLLRPDQQTWHIDGTMDWVWEEAERHGLPVATMAGRFLKDFGEIARRHPRLRLIVDHLGLPRDARDAAAFAQLPDLLALAALLHGLLQQLVVGRVLGVFQEGAGELLDRRHGLLLGQVGLHLGGGAPAQLLPLGQGALRAAAGEQGRAG